MLYETEAHRPILSVLFTLGGMLFKIKFLKFKNVETETNADTVAHSHNARIENRDKMLTLSPIHAPPSGYAAL